MLLVKVYKDFERAARAAVASGADPDAPRAVVGQLVALIDAAESARALGIHPTKRPGKADKGLLWLDAWRVCHEVLGDAGVKKPANPDPSWYARITSRLRHDGVSLDQVRELAEYVRDRVATGTRPQDFTFLVNCRDRILAGEFDRPDMGADGRPRRQDDWAKFGPGLDD